MRSALIGVVLLALTGTAFADGPTVGATCTATWSAVTKDDKGVDLPSDVVVTYKIYLSTDPAAPQLATVQPIAATSYQPCLALATGQYYIWVSAVAKTPSGSESEGLKSAMFPFVLIRPGATTLTVK